MLQSMDSVEYTGWMAFERSHGPVNGEWDAEALAALHEQLQQISYLLGQAHFTDKTHKRGPIPKPERYPRPHEAVKRARNIEDYVDEAEWLPLTEDELLDVTINPDESTGEGGEE